MRTIHCIQNLVVTNNGQLGGLLPEQSIVEHEWNYTNTETDLQGTKRWGKWVVIKRGRKTLTYTPQCMFTL